jgi:ABC-type nitrate/sulfonate/bicarbonate transport system substrate-binding protein
MQTTRRAALGASLSALGTLALPGLLHAAGVEQKSFELIGVRDPQLGAQLAIADQLGLFKAEGIEPTIRWTQSAADTLTIMGGGSAPIGVGGSFTQVVFGGQKLPIKTITALADIAETQGFALSPGVKLASPKELEGKRLAFTQGNSQVVLLAKLADMFGFDQSKIALVNMNQSEGVVAASKGDVHGLLGWQPNLFRLVAMGGTMYCTGGTLYVTGQPQVMPEDNKPLYNHSTLMATEEWIATRPNTLAALVRAIGRATDIINTERARAMTALQRVLRVDADALAVMVNANKYAIGISPALIASHRFQSQWAMNIKRVPEAPKPEDCFSTRIVELVNPALASWRPAA